ncbi:MAG: DNA-binding transcriptional regulator DhaR [Bacteroidetes bacterium ADurb.Bin408]|nr:MAG: DNA-binding transcriptional regulator DhaR [Bacteroidetes bacterium ADurb.Bin408]
MSIIEEKRTIAADTLRKYLPQYSSELPVLFSKQNKDEGFASERDIMYKLLFDMKKEMVELKKLIFNIYDNNNLNHGNLKDEGQVLNKLYNEFSGNDSVDIQPDISISKVNTKIEKFDDTAEIIEESLSLQDREIDLIKKALEKYNGKRKKAADELGISERTLYRKIKEYNLE